MSETEYTAYAWSLCSAFDVDRPRKNRVHGEVDTAALAGQTGQRDLNDRVMRREPARFKGYLLIHGDLGVRQRVLRPRGESIEGSYQHRPDQAPESACTGRKALQVHLERALMVVLYRDAPSRRRLFRCLEMQPQGRTRKRPPHDRSTSSSVPPRIRRTRRADSRHGGERTTRLRRGRAGLPGGAPARAAACRPPWRCSSAAKR